MRKSAWLAISILVIVSTIVVSCAPAPAQPAAQAPATSAAPAVAKATTAPAAPAAPAAAGKKTQLTVEMSVYVEAPHKKAFDMLKEQYEKLNPNIEIVYRGSPYAEFWDKLTTEIVAGTEACIVQMQSGNTRYAAYAALRTGETGAFVNLDKYIKGTPLETDLTDQNSLTYNGHYIGLSDYAWGTRAVFYRKSLFKDAGINADEIKTNEDFLAAAKKLTKKGANGKPDQYGFGAVVGTHSFVYDEMKTFIMRPASQGVYFPGEQGPYTADRLVVNSEANIWAAKWWQNMILKEKVVPPGSFDKAQERELFWNGTVAMNIDGPWFVGMTEQQDPKLLEDLGVFATPDTLYKGQKYPQFGSVGGITHLISSKCATPEEAWKFMEWMAKPEAQDTVAVSGMIPANTKYSGSPDYAKKVPLNAQIVSFLNTRYKMPPMDDPNIPQMSAIAQVMVDSAQEMYVVGTDPTKSLNDAQEKIKKILSK